LARAVSKFLSIAQRTISSAYAKIKKGKGKLRLNSSSIRMFHRKGDSTLPCGQPSSVLAVKEDEAFVRVLERELRKSPKIFTKKRGQPFFIRLFRIAGCQAASKADFMSKNAQQVISFFFLLSSISLTRERDADSVDRPALKPC
jgi:hypothetical protein